VDDEGIKQRYYKKYGQWSAKELIGQFSMSEEQTNKYTTALDKIIRRLNNITYYDKNKSHR